MQKYYRSISVALGKNSSFGLLSVDSGEFSASSGKRAIVRGGGKGGMDGRFSYKSLNRPTNLFIDMNTYATRKTLSNPWRSKARLDIREQLVVYFVGINGRRQYETIPRNC